LAIAALVSNPVRWTAAGEIMWMLFCYQNVVEGFIDNKEVTALLIWCKVEREVGNGVVDIGEKCN